MNQATLFEPPAVKQPPMLPKHEEYAQEVPFRIVGKPRMPKRNKLAYKVLRELVAANGKYVNNAYFTFELHITSARSRIPELKTMGWKIQAKSGANGYKEYALIDPEQIYFFKQQI